jgi:anti-anti-sigma regulatory factor
MTMPAGKVRLLRQDDVAWIGIEGRATLLHSPAVRAFGRYWLRDRGGTLLLDLSACQHLDSTFVGTLLYLQREQQRGGRGRLGLANVSPACLRLLREMGVKDLFELVESPAVPQGEWTTLDPETGGSSQVRACAVEAHQALAAVAGGVFSRIAECLPPSPNDPTPHPSSSSDAPAKEKT